MSGYSTPQSVVASAQPKQISSRLLNMKFMQRASATAVQKNASTPSTPTGERAPKRRRTGDFATTVSSLNSPSAISTAPSTPTYGDRTTSSSALKADPNGASTREGSNTFDVAGDETEWVLNVRLPVANGVNRQDYDDDESEEDEDVDEEIWSSTNPRGRQTYGSFDKKKRKTTDSTPGKATTPTTSSNKLSNKRSRPDFDDEDLSSLSSAPGSEDNSEGEIEESPKPRKQKPGTFDFKSEEDLKRMDASDLQTSGFDSGFGRQRHGLAGGGGGGRGGMGAFASPAFPRNGGGQGRKNHKKGRKTM